MSKIALLLVLLSLGGNMFAQRKSEVLDRGLIAIPANGGNFISWRIPGEEWYNVAYNLYRDGAKLNSEPISVSNYKDASGTSNSTYAVAAVINGIEQALSKSVTPWGNIFKEIQLDLPADGILPDGTAFSYFANDMSVGHLNNDSSLDLVVKWDGHSYDNSQPGYTGNVILDGYTLEGEKLWRIDLGVNIRAGAHYNPYMVYDFDGDGIAELACKTAPGTKDGTGNFLSKGPAASDDDSANYVNTEGWPVGFILDGPEYLTIFSGKDGRELETVLYVPNRYPANGWGSDEIHNRVDRFLACVAYLDGSKPSLVMTRGYYGRSVLAAWDWDGTSLTQRWVFDSSVPGNEEFGGQGNHNLSVADVDADGKDEIVYGSMTVDDNGTGLYSTGLGHGDAMHVSDLDPYRKGLEVFKCMEGGGGGTALYDAADGKMLIRHLTYDDCGRCCAANISNTYKGAEVWGGGKVFASSTKKDITSNDLILSQNSRIFWDGDLLEELLDHTVISKTNATAPIFTATGADSNNGTKATSNLSADIFGDWREEVIYRDAADRSKIRIYSTIVPTSYRNYTLMHDRQYRLGVAWENVGYNQPPHLSYFLGEAEGMTVPPPPIISNERLLYKGTGSWDTSSAVWTKDGVTSSYSNGEHVYFNGPLGIVESIVLTETVMPSVLTVASPGDYSLTMDGGKLSGEMKMIKQGKGTFSLNGNHDFTGATEVWGGTLSVDGELINSPVLVNRFGELAFNGAMRKGCTLRYGSKLYVGGINSAGTLITSDLSLIEEKSELVFDLYGLSNNRNDSLKVTGDLNLAVGSVIRITPHLGEGEKLAPGTYQLASCGGTINCQLDQMGLEGIPGTPSELVINNGCLYLIVKEMRAATTVFWNGNISNEWNMLNTRNFLNNSAVDIFATGDDVIFNDNAVTKQVSLTEDVLPGSVTFDNSSDYTVSGVGAIAGNTQLTKNGVGKLSITNNNKFSGKVLIKGGVLEVNDMANSIEGNGALGGVSDDASLMEIDGGTFSVVGDNTVQRALTIGTNGGAIYTSSVLKWESTITGGQLTKTGNGELGLLKANDNSELVIKAGIVHLTTDEALPGKKVVFEGGTLKCHDNGNSFSLATYPLVIEEGQRGTMYVDPRCEYRNTLTGAGTLNLNIPWIRTDFAGNWSEFGGIINLLGTSWFRNYNAFGYGKAKLYLASGAVFTAMNGQPVQIGSLMGSGKIVGASSWSIGARNEDFAFSGVIEGGSLDKLGTGTMSLSGSNIYTGITNVNAGTLMALNGSGSATGTGNVYVKNGAFLGGSGTIAGSVNVQDGGTLYAGNPSYYTSSLNVYGVNLNAGAIFYVKANPTNSKCNKIKVTNSFNANGQLIMSPAVAGAYTSGQSFAIVSATSITGAFTSVTPAVPGEGLIWDFSEFNTLGIVKVAASTGLANTRSVETLNLFPNPSSGLVYLNLPVGCGKAVIQVQNLNGQLVNERLVANSSEVELDLSDLDKGIYIVRASLENKVLMQKLILK